jgi:squalene-associated FAD-dependent desaturase
MTHIVIGGGWSGLAAATTLSQQGKQVHLLESAKQLGGRARNVKWGELTVDNGQHLMIGAYQHMLTLFSDIGIKESEAFYRYPLDITMLDAKFPSLSLSANALLPWPLSLIWSLIKSAGWPGFLAIARLQRNIPHLLNEQDIAVEKWLHITNQPQRLIKQLWEPLCLATLNTPIDRASAHLLAIVVRDSLGKGKREADLLIPKQALGDLFTTPAAQYIHSHGGQISLQTKVTELSVGEGKVTGVHTQHGFLKAEHVIIATHPASMHKLLPPNLRFDEPSYYPIATVYLQYPAQHQLTKPMFGMTGTISQWIFDRSQQHPGLMAVVISGPGRHEQLDNNGLAEIVASEVSSLISELPAQPISHWVIREKRATFAAHYGCEQERPAYQTNIANLWLANDYISNDYPATLEGAILNGKNCAQLCAQSRF